MKSAFRYTLLGLAAYAFFMVANMPAARIVPFIQSMVPEQYRVTLQGMEGTWHNGSAMSVRIRGVEMHDLRWRLRWLDLVIGRAGAVLSFTMPEGGVFNGIFRTGPGSQSLKDVKATIPLRAVYPLLPDYGFRIGGVMQGSLRELTVDSGMIVSGQGTFVWRDAKVLAPQNFSLGDLNAEMSTVNEGTKIVLSDAGGPLQLDAVLLLKPDGVYDFTGYFSARENSEQVLKDTLALFGTPGSDGRIYVSHSAALPLFGQQRNVAAGN